MLTRFNFFARKRRPDNEPAEEPDGGFIVFDEEAGGHVWPAEEGDE